MIPCYKGFKSVFYYVYMLSDCATHTHHYVGMTSLKPAERLAIHNAGSVPHTSKFRPWEIDATDFDIMFSLPEGG